MNILWVKVGGLWPLNIGGRLRTFHTIAELSRIHRVSVLTTHGRDDDPSVLAARLPHCEEVISIPFTAPKAGTRAFAGALVRSWLSSLPVDLRKWQVPELRARAEAIVRSGRTDLIVCDFLHAYPNVPFEAGVPVVLFSHNVEHMIWRRLATNERRWTRRALLEIEWRKMRTVERDACNASRAVVAVSPVDAEALRAIAPRAPIHAVPTGVDTTYFAANGRPEQPHHLVFTGAMDWYPNEDAMLHFIGEILPSVRAQIADVTLTIVGRNPSARLRTAADAAGVAVTGTVSDVRPFIDEGAVYIVPLRVGGGTRLKIFEALSMSKAVVSTTVGAEGLPLNDGQHFLRADSPAAFTSSVVSLLRDPARRETLGRAGRDLVESRYSWTKVAHEFASHLS